jgi:hypothetical protein
MSSRPKAEKMKRMTIFVIVTRLPIFPASEATL